MKSTSLQWRGLSYDLARGQRAHMLHLKRVLTRLAELGYNLLTIHLEYRFEFPSCPGVSQTGSLTVSQARKHVAAVFARLISLQPGLSTLRSVVFDLDTSIGLDKGGKHWLAIHQTSLREHVQALRRLRFGGDSVLEFGEFLRRPASVTQRVTWR